MDMQLFFTILGVITIVVGELVYIKEIFKKTAKPHPFTWLGWSVLTGFVAIAQWSGGAGIAFGVLAIEAVMTFFIFLLALKYGEKKFYKTDYLAFVLGMFAVVLWYLTKTPLWSVILVTVADVLVFIPTIRKTFEKPFDEELSEYFTSSLAYFFSFFALSKISLITFFLSRCFDYFEWNIYYIHTSNQKVF